VSDRNYVRRYGLFGRSRPAPSTNEADHWGTRSGTKYVKSYDKPEIDALRVELELRSRFLRQHEIKDPYDFPKLTSLLPRKNIYFAKIDDLKLIDHLRRRGFSGEEIIRICRRVDSLKPNLYAALFYLRRKVHLTNVSRLLTSLRTNQAIREALGTWAEQWAK
jgi:hypothetical protein